MFLILQGMNMQQKRIKEKENKRRLSLFPSAVRTASGSKGIISVRYGHP
jgi:hypothetical protein